MVLVRDVYVNAAVLVLASVLSCCLIFSVAALLFLHTGADCSPHLQYLRELAVIQDALWICMLMMLGTAMTAHKWSGRPRHSRCFHHISNGGRLHLRHLLHRATCRSCAPVLRVPQACICHMVVDRKLSWRHCRTRMHSSSSAQDLRVLSVLCCVLHARSSQKTCIPSHQGP